MNPPPFSLLSMIPLKKKQSSKQKWGKHKQNNSRDPNLRIHDPILEHQYEMQKAHQLLREKQETAVGTVENTRIHSVSQVHEYALSSV